MPTDGCQTEGCTGDPYATVHTILVGGFPAVQPNADFVNTPLGQKAEDSTCYGCKDVKGKVNNIPNYVGVADDAASFLLVEKYFRDPREIFIFASYTDQDNGDISVSSIGIWNRSNADVAVADIGFDVAGPRRDPCPGATCIYPGPQTYQASMWSTSPNQGYGAVAAHSNEVLTVAGSASNPRNVFSPSLYDVTLNVTVGYYWPSVNGLSTVWPTISTRLGK